MNAIQKKVIWAVSASVLLVILALWSTCSTPSREAIVQISQCVNQDNIPLSGSVLVTCEGQTKRWSAGKSIQFRIKLLKPTLVSLKADAGQDFIYTGEAGLLLDPAARKTLALTFYQIYTINIHCMDKDGNDLDNVQVEVDGISVGATNSEGTFQHKLDGNEHQAGESIPIACTLPGYLATESAQQTIELRPHVYDYPLIILMERSKVGQVAEAGSSSLSLAPAGIYEFEAMAFDKETNQPLANVNVLLGTRHLGSTNSKGLLRKKIEPVMQTDQKTIDFNKFGYHTSDVEPSGSILLQPDKKSYSVKAYLIALRKLEVSGTPQNAEITLTAKDGLAQTFGTNQPIMLKPDLYKYIIKKVGYRSMESEGYDINLLTNQTKNLDYQLLSEEAQDFSLWSNVPPPGANESPRRYVDARDSMGVFHLRNEDYALAIEAFKQAMEFDKTSYIRHYYLGWAFYKSKKFQEAINALDQLEVMKQRITPSVWAELRLDMLYMQGDCRYRLWEQENTEPVKRELAYTARTALQNFIDQISDQNKAFQAKKRDAVRKKGQIDQSLTR